jgi:hypothetical protein
MSVVMSMKSFFTSLKILFGISSDAFLPYRGRDFSHGFLLGMGEGYGSSTSSGLPLHSFSPTYILSFLFVAMKLFLCVFQRPKTKGQAPANQPVE